MACFRFERQVAFRENWEYVRKSNRPFLGVEGGNGGKQVRKYMKV